MELTDDLSQANDELRETLSHISKHSKQTTSQRVSDWVNEVNEPDSVSNQPHTISGKFNNVAGSSNPAVIPASTDVVQIRQETPPVRSLANVNIGPGQSQNSQIGISSNSTILRPNITPPSLAAVNPLPIFQLPPVNTTSNTVSSMTLPVVNQQSLSLFPQVRPSTTPGSTTLVSASTAVYHSWFDNASSQHTDKSRDTELVSMDISGSE